MFAERRDGDTEVIKKLKYIQNIVSICAGKKNWP